LKNERKREEEETVSNIRNSLMQTVKPHLFHSRADSLRRDEDEQHQDDWHVMRKSHLRGKIT